MSIKGVVPFLESVCKCIQIIIASLLPFMFKRALLSLYIYIPLPGYTINIKQVWIDWECLLSTGISSFFPLSFCFEWTLVWVEDILNGSYLNVYTVKIIIEVFSKKKRSLLKWRRSSWDRPQTSSGNDLRADYINGVWP